MPTFCEAHLRHALHYIDVGKEAEQLCLERGENVLRGLALFDHDRAQFEATFSWLENHVCGESSVTISPLVKLLAALVRSLTYIGELRLNPRERIRWYMAQRTAARIVKDFPMEGIALRNLGNAHRHLGKCKPAIACYHRALGIARQVGDRTTATSCLRGSGAAHAILGDTKKAISLLVQALELSRITRDWGEEVGILNNLGVAYKSCGKIHDAIECHKRQLAISNDHGDIQSEGYAWGNLGVAYAEIGDKTAALACLDRGLDIGRRLGMRRGYSNALWQSAIIHHEKGNRTMAIAHGSEALQLYEAVGDPRSTQVRLKLLVWQTASEERPSAV
jgi:tetratricopeptide (TPR) repeat protein